MLGACRERARAPPPAQDNSSFEKLLAEFKSEMGGGLDDSLFDEGGEARRALAMELAYADEGSRISGAGGERGEEESEVERKAEAEAEGEGKGEGEGEGEGEGKGEGEGEGEGVDSRVHALLQVAEREVESE